MTFEDIQKANETIKTTKIKNKDYAEVNQRIKAFRMVYPNGTIDTEIVNDDPERFIIRATVWDEEKHLLGTGTAYEKEGSSQINRTSYIENCETSAVGRALGMCGFGIDTSVASAEEVENAQQQQAEEEKIDQAKVNTLESCIAKNGGTVAATCKYYGVEALKDFTLRQFMDCMNRMGEKA